VLNVSDIPKKFEPGSVEARWYAYWEQNGFFRSTPDGREPFTVLIPPPNVTGVLHMGHMLNNTIQDVLVRRARMLGKNACWVPGTDHASIATEAKVVQRLRKQGIKKGDLAREEFLKHAWEWTDEHGGIILKQLRTLGASCDWDRTRFTMEPDLYDAVIDCFIDLYERGLIYRGVRMINWDPEAKTALSDEEVLFKEVRSKMVHIRYACTDGSGDVVIATQRPETIMADVAIAIHPDNPKTAHLKGKTVRIPLIGREIPVIEDDYVDPEFGTGALKVTPAHDRNDYDIGKRHGLPIIDILNADGSLNEAAQILVGLDRFKARTAIMPLLEEGGFVDKIEEYTTNISVSERTDAVVEPRLSLQWFLETKDLGKPALDAVMNDEIRFHPAKFKNTYRHWMENIQDWCISRQLWWGHRIPAWFYGEGEQDYVIAKTAEEALDKARIKSGNASLSAGDIRQEDDVLDTWFSSWLWPISVFDGFKDKDNADIRYYYPTNDLVTAPEIMFFWVARMVMAGYAFRGGVPFKNVYYTGIVRDKQRRKMSKSLGNSPDPLDLIAQYGADGTRAGMLFSSPAGNDLLFDEALVEQGRNFANKIWNAFRFITMQMEEGKSYTPTLDFDEANVADQWMRSRIMRTLRDVNQHFEEYRISDALQSLYSLVWDDFCDWYIELSKPAVNVERALGIFELLMKMLHPIMPFITEDIWQRIRERSTSEALMLSAWPELNESWISDDAEARFLIQKEMVSALRNIRASKNLSPVAPLDVRIRVESDSEAADLDRDLWIFRKLQKTSDLTVGAGIDKPKGSVSAVFKHVEMIVLLDGLIDTEAEKAKILAEITRLEGFQNSVQAKLSNAGFVDRAPADVVANERQKLADATQNIEKLRANLADLS
jgi:valyl-tRNA synthetase